MSKPEAIKPTPLLSLHESNNAKMTDFAGYQLPLYYKGFKQEHLHTRQQASLFDISHMGLIEIRGQKATSELESLFPAALSTLPMNRSIITVLLNNEGGIIDDIMLTRTTSGFRLVSNGSRKYEVVKVLSSKLSSDMNIAHLEDHALIALQGPAAETVLAALNSVISSLRFLDANVFEILDISCFVSRSGYSGEDGFELSCTGKEADKVARALLAHDAVELAGLGARDSLRLEAGLCLFGHEIDETITPVEANLGWMIAKSRRTGESGFPGKEILLDQLQHGTDRIRTGLTINSRIPVREETPLFDRDKAVGNVTSGVFSPTLNHPIAQAYIERRHAVPGTALTAMVRGKPVKTTVTQLPFIKLNYKR